MTSRCGYTHNGPNVYICDASIFPSCTDETTTLSMLAFALRNREYVIEKFRRGEH
ncbi:MAG: GMC oxidoreductase [Terriglobia bacterium]|jgi:choline dehydrogenase-like flavoprotein